MCAWTKTRDITLENNIQNTNIFFGPVGQGVPLSSKEYNVNFFLRTQAEQEIYRSMAPSGILTRLLPPTLQETTVNLDVDAEMVALTTNSIPLRINSAWEE